MAQPIHLAAENGDLQAMVRLVEEHGAEVVDSTDGSGYTALHWACWNGHVDVVHYLIDDQEVNINQRAQSFGQCLTPLHMACINQHHEVIDILLAKGADPTIGDSDSRTQLMETSLSGMLDVVRRLLHHDSVRKMSIDTRSGSYGRTALWMACSAGHWEVVSDLLRAGADPFIVDDDNVSPKDVAESHEHHKCVMVLEVIMYHSHIKEGLSLVVCA